MPGTRGVSLLEVMLVIELYTLERMWTDLTDAELFWEPVPNVWGVRRRAECRTPTPFGDGEWVVDFDADLDAASDEGKAIVPMTTIGWLMWHIGSTPGLVSRSSTSSTAPSTTRAAGRRRTGAPIRCSRARTKPLARCVRVGAP